MERGGVVTRRERSADWEREMKGEEERRRERERRRRLFHAGFLGSIMCYLKFIFYYFINL